MIALSTKMTSNTTPIPYQVSASAWDTGHLPYLAFDGNLLEPGVWRVSSPELPVWIKYDFGGGNEKIIKRLKVYWGNFGDFVFQGSNDDITWIPLFSGSGQVISSQEWDFANNIAYRYYRLHIISFLMSPSPLKVAEIELHGDGDIVFQDNFTGTVIDVNKWDVNPASNISVAQNDSLIMSGVGTIGILQGKVGGNLAFIDHTKNFAIRYSVTLRDWDEVIGMVMTGFGQGHPEPIMIYTKTIGGLRGLYGISKTPLTYNNEKMICEMTYTAHTKIWNRKLKFEGMGWWLLKRDMTWEYTVPAELILMSVSYKGGVIPGISTNHHTIFDDVVVEGAVALPMKKGIIFVRENTEADVILSKSFRKLGNEVETEVGAQAKVETRVPYTGALADVDLGKNMLTTSQVIINDISKGIIMPDIGGSGKTARLRLRRVALDNWQIIVEEVR